MRAAVLRGRSIAIEQVPDPTPGPGQLVVAPIATGICGSDLHAREILGALADADPDLVPAIVPGHEFAGCVVALGAEVGSGWKFGDFVAANPFTHGPDGPATIGLSPEHTGGLAEFAAIDADRAVALPDGVDGRLGALVEPLAVAVHAVARAAATGPIVVVGAGPIGLGIVAVASQGHRAPIVVIEPSAARREVAMMFGADAAHEPGTAIAELLDEVGWRPSPVSPLLDAEPATATIFECVGRPAVVSSVLTEAPPHSRVVLAGACTAPVELQPLAITTAEISIEASYAYRPDELTVAAQLLAERGDRLVRLITSDRALAETGSAFDDLAGDPSELKILIDPQR